MESNQDNFKELIKQQSQLQDFSQYQDGELKLKKKGDENSQQQTKINNSSQNKNQGSNNSNRNNGTQNNNKQNQNKNYNNNNQNSNNNRYRNNNNNNNNGQRYNNNNNNRQNYKDNNQDSQYQPRDYRKREYRGKEYDEQLNQKFDDMKKDDNNNRNNNYRNNNKNYNNKNNNQYNDNNDRNNNNKRYNQNRDNRDYNDNNKDGNRNNNNRNYNNNKQKQYDNDNQDRNNNNKQYRSRNQDKDNQNEQNYNNRNNNNNSNNNNNQNDQLQNNGKKQPVRIGKSFQKARNGGQQRENNINNNSNGNLTTSQGRNNNNNSVNNSRNGQKYNNKSKNLRNQNNRLNDQQNQNQNEDNEDLEFDDNEDENGTEYDEEEKNENNDDLPDDNDDVPLSQLTEILMKKFKRNRLECMICCNKIKAFSKIWNCKRCYQPFHLSCSKKWILSNAENKESKKDHDMNWNCPKCNFVYAEKLPEYFCFCEKRYNPEFEKHLLPHSCGEVCEKKRGPNCIHPCQMECHPGPCQPCSKQGPTISCHCGQETMSILCSDDKTSFKCDNICNKLLNCKEHRCERPCHVGPCNDCSVQVDISCFCSKIKKIGKCGQPKFSCKDPCGKILDCKKHECKYTCHDGPCEDCQLKPELVNKCPCGKFTLDMLVGENTRSDCTDLVPVCGLPCKQLLPCGEHYCTKTCHNGDCMDCQEEIYEQCRCGESSIKIKCHESYDPHHEEYVCHKKCKKTLSCKKHKCEIECCTAKNGQDLQGVHLCLKVCSKKLNCGKHNCSEFCHLGQCKKCPIVSNQPLTCACGKAVKQPPIVCGTLPPECFGQCQKKRDCGHPCYAKCHLDQCMPCQEPVDKQCRCGQQIIKGVSCSKEALCLVECQKVLECGHKCGIKCHVGECPKKKCNLKCNKKKICSHNCSSYCHGQTPCPTDPCKVEITIKCKCGNREAFVECGATDVLTEHTLECNSACSNKQRFGFFYKNLSDQPVYYPSSLLRFANYHMQYLQKLEEKIESMIKSGKQSIEMPFQQDLQKKTSVQLLLSRHYNADVQYYTNFKNPYFVIRQTENTIIPKTLLSSYYKQVQNGTIKPETLPFETILRFNNLNIQDNMSQIDFLLKDFQHEYYIEKSDNNQCMSAMFWKDSVAQQAQKKLKKSQSCFSNFTVEFNEKLEKEDYQQQQNIKEVVKKTVKKLKNNDDSSDDDGVITMQKQQSSNISKQRMQNKNVEVIFQEYTEEDLEVRKNFEDKACLHSFCSQEEIQRREMEMDINIFEQDTRQTQSKINKETALKKYERIGQDGQTAAQIRSPDVLNKASWYLIQNVIDCDTLINTPYKMPIDKTQRGGKKRIFNYEDIYEFMADRMKAIRQDFTVLGNPDVPQTIESLELISLFYIISISEGMLQDNIDVNKILFELEAILTTLTDLYQNTQHEDSKQQQAFYYSFLLLFSSKTPVNYQQNLQKLPQTVLESEYITDVLEVVSAIQNKDHSLFFKKLKQMNVLFASAMSVFLYKIRLCALINFHKVKYDLTAEEFQKEVEFDDLEETINFLDDHGINTENLEEPDEYVTDEEAEKEEQEKLKQQKEEEEQKQQQQQQQEEEEQKVEEPKEKVIVFRKPGELKFTNSKLNKPEEIKKKQKKVRKLINFKDCKKIKVKNLQKDDPLTWKQYSQILHILLMKRNVELFNKEDIEDHDELPRENELLVSRYFIIKHYY